jgi:hypothetical protein
MAAHPKVGCYSNQKHRHGAQGQDQEQPDHPHDVLGYQNEVQRALRGLVGGGYTGADLDLQHCVVRKLGLSAVRDRARIVVNVALEPK